VDLSGQGAHGLLTKDPLELLGGPPQHSMAHCIPRLRAISLGAGVLLLLLLLLLLY
jgi:hypothetical protein